MDQMAGAMRFNLTCPRCGGKGRLQNACPTCYGEGRVSRQDTVEVRIPAGVQSGSRLRVAGKGNAGTHGAPAGDLYITIRVEPHPFFERDGDNIEIRVPVTVTGGGLGAKIEVPTIDGRALLKIPQGTQNGQKFRLREKGVYNARKNTRGDQIVEVVLQAPEGARRANEGTAAGTRAGASRTIRAQRFGRRSNSEDMAKGRSKAAYMISAVAEQYRDPSPDVAAVRAGRAAAAIPQRRQHAAVYGRGSGAAGSDPEADARTRCESCGGRDHPEHAREDGSDAAADGGVREDAEHRIRFAREFA